MSEKNIPATKAEKLKQTIADNKEKVKEAKVALSTLQKDEKAASALVLKYEKSLDTSNKSLQKAVGLKESLALAVEKANAGKADAAANLKQKQADAKAKKGDGKAAEAVAKAEERLQKANTSLEAAKIKNSANEIIIKEKTKEVAGIQKDIEKTQKSVAGITSKLPTAQKKIDDLEAKLTKALADLEAEKAKGAETKGKVAPAPKATEAKAAAPKKVADKPAAKAGAKAEKPKASPRATEKVATKVSEKTAPKATTAEPAKAVKATTPAPTPIITKKAVTVKEVDGAIVATKKVVTVKQAGDSIAVVTSKQAVTVKQADGTSVTHKPKIVGESDVSVSEFTRPEKRQQLQTAKKQKPRKAVAYSRPVKTIKEVKRQREDAAKKSAELLVERAERRPLRKTRTGIVVSNKMDKTIVVAVVSKVKHPIYKKTVNQTKRYKAHDENNTAGIGDTVLIAETRKLSKNKYFRLVDIVARAK